LSAAGRETKNVATAAATSSSATQSAITWSAATATTSCSPATAATQVEEVWFSGCHTNVGGGYSDSKLSNITLIWLLKAARDAGIMIDLRGLPDYDWQRSHDGNRRDSYREFYDELGLVGVVAEKFKLKRDGRKIGANQRIHTSVFEIMQDPVDPGKPLYVPSARYNGSPLSTVSNPGIEPWGEL